MKPLITRREFLKTTAAGAGLTIAAVMTPQGLQLVSAEEAKKEELRALKPLAWLTITQDNIVTITVNKSEMGQGVYTSLPMIVADELDADWKQVRFAAAPAGDEYKDPVWKSQATGGSSSVRNMYGPLRTMGAAMREMLVIAAARTWAAPVKDCAALMGAVKHVKTGQCLYIRMQILDFDIFLEKKFGQILCHFLG